MHVQALEAFSIFQPAFWLLRKTLGDNDPAARVAIEAEFDKRAYIFRNRLMERYGSPMLLEDGTVVPALISEIEMESQWHSFTIMMLKQATRPKAWEAIATKHAWHSVRSLSLHTHPADASMLLCTYA